MLRILGLVYLATGWSVIYRKVDSGGREDIGSEMGIRDRENKKTRPRRMEKTGYLAYILMGNSHQIQLSGACHGLGAVVHIQLAVYVVDMSLDSAYGDDKFFGDLSVGQAPGD